MPALDTKAADQALQTYIRPQTFPVAVRGSGSTATSSAPATGTRMRSVVSMR